MKDTILTIIFVAMLLSAFTGYIIQFIRRGRLVRQFCRDMANFGKKKK